MISDCTGGGSSYHLYGLEERGFMVDFALMMIGSVPAMIGYTLWRVFATNRTVPGGTSVLGLDENSATYTELYRRGIPWRTLLFCVLVTVTTFKLGVFAFEVIGYLTESMHGPSTCP